MVLTAAWMRQLRSGDPDRIVLVDSPSGQTWTAARLIDLTTELAKTLHERGVHPGTRVIMALPPTATAVAVFIAILRLGAVVVACDPTAPTEPCRQLASDSAAALVITVPAAEPRPKDRWGGLPIVVLAELLAQTDSEWRSRSPANRTVSAPPSEPEPEPTLDASASTELGLICYTSGTTGSRKAVPLTTGQLLAGTAALNQIWEWTSSDVLVVALPLFHVHGLVVAVAGSLNAGSKLVISGEFDPKRVVSDLNRYRASMFFAVPSMWWRLERTGSLAPPLNLRLAVSGSAPLSPQLFERLMIGLGQAPVERYGMTETLILTSNPVRGPRKPGSVGLPLPGVRMRVAVDGVIEVTGPTVMRGYENRPAGEGFTADGWFRTGDLGYFDSDGYLRLTGRASDLIITGGHNVHPAEVEQVLRAAPGVAEVAVTGVPDERWGQMIAAFIVPTDATAQYDSAGLLAALRNRCVTELAPYQQPRIWRLVPELPRNTMGKVLRSALLEGGSDR